MGVFDSFKGETADPIKPWTPGGQVYDNGSYGGYKGVYSDDPNVFNDGGPLYKTDSQGNMRSGAQDAVNRYQGLANTQYEAPQLDATQSDQARGYQQNGLQMMYDAANGSTPSRAEILGRQATDNAVAGTYSTAASIKGGAGARVAAMRAAQSMGAQQAAQGNQQVMAMRADEMARAREGFLAGTGQMRQQDVGAAAVNAQLQAGAHASQQQNQQYYEGMANSVNNAQLNANLGFATQGSNANYQERAADRADEDQTWKEIGAGASLVAGVSDERAKTNIEPIYVASGSGPMQVERHTNPDGSPYVSPMGPPSDYRNGIEHTNPFGGDDIVRENPYGSPEAFDAPGPGGGNDIDRNNPYGAAPKQGPTLLQRIGSGLKNFGASLNGPPQGGAQGAYMPQTMISDTRAKEEAVFNRGRATGMMQADKEAGRPFVVDATRPPSDGVVDTRSPAEQRAAEAGANVFRATLRHPIDRAETDDSPSFAEPIFQGTERAANAAWDVGTPTEPSRLEENSLAHRLAARARAVVPTTSDERAKKPISDAEARRMMAWADGEQSKLRAARGDDAGDGIRASIDAGYAAGPTLSGKETSNEYVPPSGDEMLNRARQMRDQLDEQGDVARGQGPAARPTDWYAKDEDPIAQANRSYEPSAYRYKPGFGEDTERTHVGPMAQNMAADPVASTAVLRDPKSGTLMLDQQSVGKLSLSGIASLQRQLDELKAQRGAR